MTKRNESRCTHKNLYMNVPSNITHSSPKWNQPACHRQVTEKKQMSYGHSYSFARLHHKIPQAGWLQQQRLSTHTHPVWGQKSNIKMLAILVSPHPSSLLCRWLIFHHVLTWPFVCTCTSLASWHFLIRTPVLLD
jgi:hypothetical protein